MKITKLYMDPQDKTRFEIQGKASVKYHLKANHVVEAKRWFWALNNAIQWTKDEAKEEERQKQRNADSLRQAKLAPQQTTPEGIREGGPADSSRYSGKSLTPATAVGVPLSKNSSRISFQEPIVASSSIVGDDEGSIYEPSLKLNEDAKSTKGAATNIPGDVDDDDEYGDDASSHELQPATKDAFNITAHSANLQLSLLAQVSAALQAESAKGSTTPISDPNVSQAISTYQSAVRSLQGLVGDLLKIARDRDAYWQYRLDREADVRRMWEDSMAKVAKEQEELEGRIGESEDKRKRTKRALREALESGSIASTRPGSPQHRPETISFSEAVEKAQEDRVGLAPPRRKSIGTREAGRRKSVIADLTNLSDSDSEDDEEFFDAVDAGEVEVGEMPPSLPSLPDVTKAVDEKPGLGLRESKLAQIEPSFKGYEDPVRKRFKMDADNRPKISLWVRLQLHTRAEMLLILVIGHPEVHDWKRYD